MENSAVAAADITRVKGLEVTAASDLLAVEEPLEIRLLYTAVREPKTIAVTMRTPGQDEALAAGFLFTEGIISDQGQIKTVGHFNHDKNRVLVTLRDYESPELQQAERNFYTTSSCGICGKTSIEAVRMASPYKNEPDEIRIPAQVFYGLQAALRREQAVFESTGGLHASALFHHDGRFIRLCEDVGRHNALDKVIGSALLDGQLPLDQCILLLSGRASFELIQKAAMAGMKIVAAVGAPSSLAAQMAADCDITLIGFLRDERFNIYAHPQRIVL